ncbi:MAG: DUF2384 domain-containing protein [Proteobacteria bacterium]|nr:DUF2384 domain-containing protein [Pseudomonadota bacterium]
MTQRPLYEQHVSGPALAAFLRVSAAWGLDEPQERMLLGQPSPETLRNWKQNRTGALSLDQVERISYVLRIFRLLQESSEATAWLSLPRAEPIFGGRRPIDVMCLEDIRGLRQVAQFLQAMVGPEQADPSRDHPSSRGRA